MSVKNKPENRPYQANNISINKVHWNVDEETQPMCEHQQPSKHTLTAQRNTYDHIPNTKHTRYWNHLSSWKTCERSKHP